MPESPTPAYGCVWAGITSTAAIAAPVARVRGHGVDIWQLWISCQQLCHQLLRQREWIIGLLASITSPLLGQQDNNNVSL